MEFEFGKYTDITNFAKKINPEMFAIYEKVYICPDTRNWWLSCVQKDISSEYERIEGYYLIERADINYPTEKLDKHYLNQKMIKQVLLTWEGDCWDNCEAHSLEEVNEIIDGGYGINPEE